MSGEEKPQVMEWECPVCGKIIRSIYPRQFTELVKVHELHHELKRTPKKVKKHGKAGES
jgi:rRNA maturation protein Nop10